MDTPVSSGTDGTLAGRMRPRDFALVATALAAAVLYGLMRIPEAHVVHRSFAAVCTRLSMRLGDWPCRVRQVQIIQVYVGAALLGGLALALPAAVLAATGRRLLFVVPALVPAMISIAWALGASFLYPHPADPAQAFLGVTPNDGPLWVVPGESFWTSHAYVAAVVTVVLVLAPAALIALRVRPRRASVADPQSSGALAAFAICAAGTGVVLATARLTHLVGDWGLWLLPVGVMFAFGMLLSTDRRWWPWILVPEAVLLSGGPETALRLSLWRFENFSQFALALPLVAVGLIACAWEPLAVRLERRISERRAERADEDDEDDEEFREYEANRRPPSLGPDDASPSQPVRDLRPLTVVNALAAGMLIVAVVMFAADPSSAQMSMSLPTYLGPRVQVEDVVTRVDLSRALVGANDYYSSHGTYVGFDAVVGRRAVPSLTWRDGALSGSTTPSNSSVAVVDSPTDTQVLLAKISTSGNAFCISDDQEIGAVRYGSGVGATTRKALAAAIAACGSRPWGPSALRLYPVGTLCTGVDPGSLPICRAVQRLIRQELQHAGISSSSISW